MTSPGRLDGAARHREDVVLQDAVHAGDADGREQAADRRRDQADEERDQDRRRRGAAPRRCAKGRSVTVAIRKTIVRPASRIESAISLGVFWREAPSTSAIIRSRNVSPGFDVISTTIRSERTRVPPVTADRSPPDSRMTGADSPVIADSSTEAMPSTTVPSPGIDLAGLDDDAVALAQRRRRDATPRPSCVGRRAIVSVRPRRSAAACALPRPSAIASAKLAKRSVNQSQRAIWRLKSTSLPRGDVAHEQDA